MRTCITVKWKHFKQTEATSGNDTWPKVFISTEILIQLYYKSFVFDTKKICMSLSSNHVVDGWKKLCCCFDCGIMFGKYQELMKQNRVIIVWEPLL